MLDRGGRDRGHPAFLQGVSSIQRHVASLTVRLLENPSHISRFDGRLIGWWKGGALGFWRVIPVFSLRRNLNIYSDGTCIVVLEWNITFSKADTVFFY